MPSAPGVRAGRAWRGAGIGSARGWAASVARERQAEPGAPEVPGGLGDKEGGGERGRWRGLRAPRRGGVGGGGGAGRCPGSVRPDAAARALPGPPVRPQAGRAHGGSRRALGPWPRSRGAGFRRGVPSPRPQRGRGKHAPPTRAPPPRHEPTAEANRGAPPTKTPAPREGPHPGHLKPRPYHAPSYRPRPAPGESQLPASRRWEPQTPLPPRPFLGHPLFTSGSGPPAVPGHHRRPRFWAFGAESPATPRFPPRSRAVRERSRVGTLRAPPPPPAHPIGRQAASPALIRLGAGGGVGGGPPSAESGAPRPRDPGLPAASAPGLHPGRAAPTAQHTALLCGYLRLVTSVITRDQMGTRSSGLGGSASCPGPALTAHGLLGYLGLKKGTSVSPARGPRPGI